HEDDAERAVRAALSIVWAVDRIGGAAAGRSLRARAAVTSGEAAVTVGAVDQGLVTGDLVNIAARLQGKAPPGGVVVDRATRDAASASIPFVRLGSLALKGRTGRLETYRATSLPDGPIPRNATHTGRLVGRDRELREIRELLQSVIDEHRSRLVSVTGIAGIGKSRLVWELDQWVDAHPVLIHWHEGRALAYGEGVAFSAVGQMVRRRAKIADDAAPELARRQLAASLEELVRDDAERRWIEPRLATLIDGEEEASFDRDELFAAWRRFFERVADRSPSVLVFEDLHWADPSLLDFVEHLAIWARDLPIFVMTLARPELLDRRPAWGAGVGSFTSINLTPLDDMSMRTLLDDRAPGLPGTIAGQVLRDAGGVPLYAVEVARMLTDRAADSRAEDASAAPAVTRDVPDSLRGVIAARLDGLPASERRLLMAAAVLGHRFRPDTLMAVSDEEPTQLREQLDSLVRREMLVVDDDLGSPGRGQLSFVQDLVREVAYQTLARSERRTLHLAVARHLESLDEDAPDQLAVHLVEAFRLTSQPREAERIAHRAIGALRRAARGATALHVPARAMEYLEAALRMADADTRPVILAEAADAARAAGRLSVAEERLRELIGLQQSAGQASAAARTRAQLASVMLTAQANELALKELEAAIRDVRNWRSEPAGLELAAQLARARSVLGDDREALHWAEDALTAAERLGVVAVATDLLITRGTARMSLGEHEAGMADLRAAIVRAEEGSVPRTELRARNNLAWALMADDPAAAFETARQGLELATELGLGDFALPLADLATAAAVEVGSWDWALETIADLQQRGVGDAYGILLSATVATIRSLRGEPAPLAELDRYEPLSADTDAQVAATARLARAWAAFLSEDFPNAVALAREGADRMSGAIQHHDRARVMRFCLWSANRDDAAAELERLRAVADWGRAAEAAVLTMEAGVLALAGDGLATIRYGAAREAWEQLEMPLQLALCLLDEQRLVGTASHSSELLAICDRLGADGLLRLARSAGGASLG
ncbi:MAG TPA: AAA family ATPase, partial [Candidatus Limnocylindria bacterium]|nr:AAA family ATPase [Candidatus Limnocylindria bacterium]